MSIATEIQRLNTAKANIKTAIESKGVTIGSSVKIDSYPTYINQIQTFDPYNGHDYVEIAGIKWATMNIGANSVTSYGQHFQWGSACGYYSSQVGTSGTSYKKPFAWLDYNFGDGKSSPGATGMTKYNSVDGKFMLDVVDDAARVNWGGSWRIPTNYEYGVLSDATTSAWTNDYQGSGVDGLILTDKTDNSKTLFFPADGYAGDGSSKNQNIGGYYWASSVYSSDMSKSYTMYFKSNTFVTNSPDSRFYGLSIRAVVDKPTIITCKYNVTDTITPTQIVGEYAQYPFSAVEIDGVEQPSVVSAYTFNTTGEHIVKYTLTDPTSIGQYAFSYCSGLTSIDIPSGVTSINTGAFFRCGNLVSITCNATTAPTITNGTFQDVKSGGTLTVPIGSSGYDEWMRTSNFYLGMYNWTKIEQ